jgi:hypothetical protein
LPLAELGLSLAQAAKRSVPSKSSSRARILCFFE